MYIPLYSVRMLVLVTKIFPVAPTHYTYNIIIAAIADCLLLSVCIAYVLHTRACLAVDKLKIENKCIKNRDLLSSLKEKIGLARGRVIDLKGKDTSVSGWSVSSTVRCMGGGG